VGRDNSTEPPGSVGPARQPAPNQAHATDTLEIPDVIIRIIAKIVAETETLTGIVDQGKFGQKLT
jgi:hypothetical protein